MEKRGLPFTVLPILARRLMHDMEKDFRKIILICKATQSCDLVDGFIRHAEQIRGGLNPNLRQILIDGYAVFLLKGEAFPGYRKNGGTADRWKVSPCNGWSEKF